MDPVYRYPVWLCPAPAELYNVIRCRDHHRRRRVVLLNNRQHQAAQIAQAWYRMYDFGQDQISRYVRAAGIDPSDQGSILKLDAHKRFGCDRSG